MTQSNPSATFSLSWEHTIPSGTHWSGIFRRGTTLRLTDLDGGGNCAMIFFNPADPLERYNMPDTLKAQHTGRLAAGHCLYSDMGRVVCSIVDSSLDWHDPLCGVSDAATMRELYGPSHYQQQRNDMVRNGRDSLLTELGKHGLGKRDLGPTVNFFSKVTANEEGKLTFHAGHAKAGDFVDVRFEMDALVCLSAAPHPLETRSVYKPSAIKLSVSKAAAVTGEDKCRNHCPENQRGFINTERHVAQQGG
jgi:urea carboxylase-associated protein 2